MLKDILYSVLWNKCPKCHSTKVFETSVFQLKSFDKMHKTCSCCGEKYEKEPGYFYGAMYVSYALMAGWFIITWAANTFIFKVGVWYYIAFILTTMILFMPLTFRISRLVWLNLFIKYKKDHYIKNQL